MTNRMQKLETIF